MGLNMPLLKDGEQGRKVKIPIVPLMIGIISVVLVIVIVVLAGNLGDAKDEIKELTDRVAEAEKIDVSYVGNKLESISELATAKMTYNGIIHFEEGEIPLINKKEFYMAYRVSVKAGFDLSVADIIITDHTVTIELPEAEIYDPVVDETSIRFFDESVSLFNKEEKDDLVEAITEAKEDVLAQPETEELKQTAKDHVTILLTALLEGQIGDRELIINVG